MTYPKNSLFFSESNKNTRCYHAASCSCNRLWDEPTGISRVFAVALLRWPVDALQSLVLHAVAVRRRRTSSDFQVVHVVNPASAAGGGGVEGGVLAVEEQVVVAAADAVETDEQLAPREAVVEVLRQLEDVGSPPARRRTWTSHGP